VVVSRRQEGVRAHTNFARDVVDAAEPTSTALIELSRDGRRRVWSFGEVADRASRLAGTLQRSGVRQGDSVMTLIGYRPEWVYAMLAFFRIGAVVLPCTEQLRAKDLALRLSVVDPVAVIADERNCAELEAVLRDSAPRRMSS
jgi:acyl-coenzyme A synthetase/AMP-(fatty) acid ligase